MRNSLLAARVVVPTMSAEGEAVEKVEQEEAEEEEEEEMM